MKKIISFLFVCCLLTSAFAQKSEEKLVRKAFENYKIAVQNQQGEKAVQFVSQKTIDYYSNMLELVKTADSIKIEALSFIDKMMVLLVRHRVPEEEILNFNGKSFVAYAINAGMIGKVSNLSIGEVTINGNEAKGQFIVNKQKTPLDFVFYKENEQWEMDLTSLLPISEMALKKVIEESGQSENEFLFSLLEMTTGTKPDNTIWQPIISEQVDK
jgi:hypothetical protein